MQDAMKPLHNEIAILKAELKENQIKTETLNTQNEAMKHEIATLHNSINALEARQKEREAIHYDLVDQRLKELFEESKKGFWARLFKK